MDFSLNEEQRLFRDSVARFVAEEYPFEKRLDIVAGNTGFLSQHWDQFAELGWLALPFPEALGGLDASPVETMVIMEQLGRGLVVSPYLATVVLSGALIRLTGSPAQQADILTPVIEGKRKLAFAYAEPPSRCRLNDIATRAARSPEGFIIDGTKSLVQYAEAADTLIVAARTQGDEPGLSLFLVEADSSGLTATHHRTHDGGRVSDLVFHHVTIANEAALGRFGTALPTIEYAIDLATAAICAEASGAMWAVYEQTLAYLKTREQFGQSLGTYQALQHRMVDMYMRCELAQSAVLDATLHIDADAATRRIAVSAAKLAIAEYGKAVGQEGIQLHGGIGTTMELPIGHYLKRLTAINSTFGDAIYHLARYQAR